MQRKWVLVAAGIAAVAVLLVAGQLLLNARTSPANTSPTMPAEQPGSTTPATSTPAPAPGSTTASASGSAETSLPLAKPGIIAPLPGGEPLAPVKPSGAAKPGDALHPLASAPPGLVAGLSVGKVPTGSAYAITFRPWGFGPADRNGQTVAVTVTKVTPVGGAPDISSLVRNPQLFVMDAKRGGNVASGGAHTAVVTFVADGDKLVPVLTKVSAPRP